MKTFIHFLLSYVLFMTSAMAYQIGEQSKGSDSHGYKKAVHEALNKAVTKRYIDRITLINSFSKSPKSLVKYIPEKDRQHYINYIQKHKVTHFPKFVREGNYFVMKIKKGLVLKITPKSMHNWEFWVNDKKHIMKDKKDFVDLVTWLENDVFANRTSSLMSLLIDEAHAGVGVLIFFGIVGVVAIWAIMTAGEMLEAEQNSKDLRAAHAKLKREHAQCKEAKESMPNVRKPKRAGKLQV